jgi:predicted secreted hydrolase
MAARVVTMDDDGNPVGPNEEQFPRDFATARTSNWYYLFGSEREARQLAREQLGHMPVEVEPGKWRSRDGKWQYRAKPTDVAQRHVHIEELDPLTGEVLQNYHLGWTEREGQ